MTNNQILIDEAFELLALAPEKAGLLISLSGGSVKMCAQPLDPIGVRIVAAAARFYRPPEFRSEIDLEAFVDEQDGMFSVRLERILGMAMFETLPDPRDYVSNFKAASIADAKAGLLLALDEHFPGVPMTLNGLKYRSSDFASTKLDTNRGAPPRLFSFRRALDKQLADFVAGVVDDAFAWGPTLEAAARIKLSFQTVGGRGRDVNAVISQEGLNFVLEVEDLGVWGWHEVALRRSFATPTGIKEVIVDYVTRANGFLVDALKVQFDHSPRATPSAERWF